MGTFAYCKVDPTKNSSWENFAFSGFVYDDDDDTHFDFTERIFSMEIHP